MTDTRKAILAQVELDRRRALSDLYFFARHVCGYRKMNERVHGKLCRFLTKEIDCQPGEQTTKLILLPRGSFKSTVGTVAYTLWRLVNNPELTILITNETSEKSKGFLKEIKGHIEANDRFKLLFGELGPQKKWGAWQKWTDGKIDLRSRQMRGKEPNAEASSVGATETGKHFDIIICDDLVGQSNYQGADLENAKQYVRDLGAVLKPGGELIVIGTRWDYRDIYQDILDFMGEMGDLARAEVMVEKAIRDDGSYYFPEELSEQLLSAQRIKLGTYFFSCQYQNEPVAREDMLVSQDDIQKYTDTLKGKAIDEFWSGCRFFCTVDLAYTDTATSDSTAMVVNGMLAGSPDWHIREARKFKTTKPSVVIDELFRIHGAYAQNGHPVVFGIEENNYKQWLKVPLATEMRNRGVFLNIKPLPHYGKQGNKAQRLRNLEPRFKQRACWIHAQMTDLEDELLTLTYDGARGHDDLLDALAMQDEVAVWGVGSPSVKAENAERLDIENRGETFGEWKSRARAAMREGADDEWMYEGMGSVFVN